MAIRPRLQKELLRKFVHLLEIPVLVGYSVARYFWGESAAIIVLTALLLILLEIEYVRLEVRPKLPAMLNVFRRHEKNNVASTVFFVAATVICVSAFDYRIAMLALLMTVFGDLVSALVGMEFGKTSLFRKKTLEGFLAGLAANVAVGVLVLPDHPEVFLSMAVAASIVELITNKLDDNLTVPLFAGFTGQMLIYILALPSPAFPEPFGWLFSLF